MSTFVDDGTKNVAVFINDFNIEFAVALEKLSHKLGRPLRGITLIDQKVYDEHRNRPDPEQTFEQIVCDFSNDAALRATVKTFEDNLLLIDASSERNQPYLKRILPHVPYVLAPTERSLEWSTHKGQMRALLTSYNPSIVPRVQTVTDASEATIQMLLSTLQLPLIVKPTGLAASILVNKVSTETELRETLTHSFQVIHDIYARDAGRGIPEMIIEEFIEGDMYSIDMYVSHDGRTWGLPPIRSKTAHSLGFDGFYTYQNESYLEIDEETIEAGQAAATEAVHGLGLRACAAHIELFHTKTGWKIIELGPRAGGYRQFMYEAAYGIDHAYNELLVKIGLEPEIPTKAIAHSLITNTYAEEEGIIEDIEGVEPARAIGSVARLDVHAKSGDEALPSGKGGKLIVDGFLSHTSQEQLLADADAVRKHLNIRTKKHTHSS
jgi:biotin carboxylase